MKKFYLILMIAFISSASFGQERTAAKKAPNATPANSSYTATYSSNATQRTPGMATIILDNIVDAWGDGSGYQMLIAPANALTSGNITCNNSTQYNLCSYKIPANAAPNNTYSVIGVAVSLDITPGTYSYKIVNPFCPTAIYQAGSGLDPTFAASYTFAENTEYRFTMQMNGVYDATVITVTPLGSSPVITANPTSLSFTGILGNTSAAKTVAVQANNLTAGVTATTSAPFSVSSDNTTYGTTATIAQTGGTLYVKYTPTSASVSNGTITLSSTGASNVTISLTGTGIDCSDNSLPLLQDFSNNSYYCWTTISNNTANGPNGTGYVMGLYSLNSDPSNLVFAFSSYYNNGVTDYNQYLISPELPVTGNELNIVFDYAAISEEGTETFRVGYSSTTNAVSAFTWGNVISTNSEDFVQYTGTAPAGTKYIAINYTSVYQYLLLVDNIDISSSVGIVNNAGAEFAVYPNPSTGMVYILSNEDAQVGVFDAIGRMVNTFSIKAGIKATFTQSAGIYFVKVNGKVQKIVIQ